MKLRRRKSKPAATPYRTGEEQRVLHERRRPTLAAPRRGPSTEAYPFEWDRDRLPSGHRGKPCKKVQPLPGSRRANGMVTIEFADGLRFVVDPRGLRKRT